MFPHDGDTLAVDLHVHSVASGHAFGTVQELWTQARVLGVHVLGISDHGPAMEGAPHSHYFTMRSDIRSWPAPPQLLFGCEANIMSLDGTLDLPDEILRSLDYVQAGLHARSPYDHIEPTRAHNTRATISSIERGTLDILTHPVTRMFPVDLPEIVAAAAHFKTALEINGRVLRGASVDVVRAHLALIALAQSHGAPLVLGTDSHAPPLVALCQPFEPLREALRCATDIIVNTDSAKLAEWLDSRRATAAR